MSTSESPDERIYTVNFRKAWITPEYKRTNRVVSMLREFAEKHMKTDDIKIDQYLNKYLWQRGKRNPPRKVRIRMARDETETVVVSLYEEAKVKRSKSVVGRDDTEQEDVDSKEAGDESEAAPRAEGETNAITKEQNNSAERKSDVEEIPQKISDKPKRRANKKKSDNQ